MLTPFPKGFRIGAATAAYQIEGAHDRDDKAPSIWDRFVQKPGAIVDGTDGRTACGHYDRLEQDLDLMADLGLEVYRFSIAWSRVLPDGRENPAGIGFYDRLVDGLLARGIAPMPTLHHWDMPQAIYETGGWRNRETSKRFADYAATMVRHLGDRVPSWITLNEPWEHAYLGHVSGEHAPGEKRMWAFLKVLHHELLGHGLGMQAMRAEGAQQVGVTMSMTPMIPRTPADQGAADRLNDFVNFSTYDAVFLGRYPPDLWRRLWLGRPKIADGDMEAISAPVDFVGLNNYSHAPAVRSLTTPFMWADSPREEPRDEAFMKNGVLHTTMGWEVVPQALGQCLRWIREKYGNPPTWITENGMALNDRVVDGAVHDKQRIDYLAAHMAQVQLAMHEGSDMRGYLAWSFMDNFEWALGLSKRFGLVHVDYDTLERTPKDSALWLRDQIAAKQG